MNTPRFHLFHKWTPWENRGEPEPYWFAGLFGGGHGLKVWQQRNCTVCGKRKQQHVWLPIEGETS